MAVILTHTHTHTDRQSERVYIEECKSNRKQSALPRHIKRKPPAVRKDKSEREGKRQKKE